MKHILLIVFASLLSLTASASELPDQEQVKKVFDFYHYGQGKGVILIDAKLCRDIHKEGDEKNNCKDDVTEQTLSAGEEVYLWMAFMVPKGDKDQTILIQLTQGTAPRGIRTLKINGSLRYRTWRKIKFTGTGNWTIRIRHDQGESARMLTSMMVAVDKSEAN